VNTFGGLPETSAFHWDDETYQKLGNIVFLIMSGNKDKALRGYIEFYQLKRNFLEYEFDGFIKALDLYREKKGFESITSIINSLGEQMKSVKGIYNVKQQSDDIAITEPFGVPKTTLAVPPKCSINPSTVTPEVLGDRVEQMCLF
jgi:hypothetical protein